MGVTWNVTKVPVDAEVSVRGNDAALKDLLTNHRGKGVLGCVHVGLDQPWVLRTFLRRKNAQTRRSGGDLNHIRQHLGMKGLFCAEPRDITSPQCVVMVHTILWRGERERERRRAPQIPLQHFLDPRL